MLRKTSIRVTRLVLLLILSTITLVSPLAVRAGPVAPPPELSTLQPGEPVTLYHQVPVNIVLVGYEQGAGARQISEPFFRQILPGSSVPIVYSGGYFQKDAAGYPLYPILYQYDYDLTFADEAFEDAFFSFLSDASEPKGLSFAQLLYNGQQERSLTVTDNHWIDALAVETWLARHAGPMLGVDTTEYTLFLVNWYSRDDFKHHVYVRTDTVDPDTGLNTCERDNWCRFIAWGGSADLGLSRPHRIWFLDLSAGPELWSGNWNVDDPELPSGFGRYPNNGVMDYRIPPVWEYGNSGYRPFTSATYDLALATRMVAINLLFTNDPLYPARLPARDYMPSEVEIDINVLQFDPSYDAGTTLRPDVVVEKLQALQPYNTFSWDRTFHEPSRRLRDVTDAFLDSFSDPTTDSLYGRRDPTYPFSGATLDLVYYLDDHKHQYLEGHPAYEVPAFTLALPEPTQEQEYPIIGYAPSLSADYPAQNLVLNLFWPSVPSLYGVGQTDVVIHETGHHLGLSHPHDGIDAEWGFVYAAADMFYFAWLGGESRSVMSYLSLQNAEFSRFDRDNMNRWMTWEHLALSNFLAARVLESPRASEVYDLLLEADENAGLALASFHARQYERAAEYASDTSRGLERAAELIEVVTDPGSSPGVWGTDGMDRSPFLRQFVNELVDQPATLDPTQLPTSLTLDEYLADPE
jgi:hypothetical protein